MRIKLSDLAPGVTYALQVRANNGSAVSQWSRVFNVTTSSDTVPPKTPTGVAGTMTGTSYNLAWSAVIESVDNTPAHDFHHYDVKVESAGTGTTRIYSITDTKFLLSLEMNREVFGSPRANIKMSVRAVDKSGNASPYSAVVDQTNPPPSTPTGFSGTPLADAIALKWNAVSDTDLSGYRVYSGTVVGTQSTLMWEGSATATTIASTLYSSDRWYKVVSLDVFGTESTGAVAGPLRPGSPFTVDTTAPAVPTGLAATLTNATDGKTAKAAVTWTAVTDTDGDLSEYIIDYKPSSESAWNTAKVDYEKNALTLVGLLPYVNYDFRIRSSDFSANLSGWSTTVTKTATANATPSVPTGLAVTAGVDNLIIRWTANTEVDMANGAGVYDVTVATNAAFTTGVLQYRTGADNIAVNGLATGQIYYARVGATDSGGLSSAYATAVNATTGNFPVTKFNYIGDGPPPAEYRNVDSLWIDTTLGANTPKRWVSGTTWAVVTDKVATDAALAVSVTAGSGSTKTFHNPVVWGQSGSSLPGTIVIDTPITFSARMCTINITGFNYVTGNGAIDITVSFYAFNLTSFLTNTSSQNRSTDSQIGAIRLARKTGTDTVSILIDTLRAGWAYPKITVPEAIVGHTLPPDSWKDGWTCSLLTDLSGYTNVMTPTKQDLTENYDTTNSWRYTGTTEINGGSIRTDTIDVIKLKAGSTFTQDLQVASTFTLGTSTLDGLIKSYGYTDAGTSGFKLTKAGMVLKGSGNVVDGGTVPSNTLDVNSLKTSTLTATTINLGATGVINIDSTGAVKSNNYALNSTGYKLSNTGLEINDGVVDAKALKTGSAIIGDLIIGRSADALGTIKSFDYSAGTAGWKIGKGLFEINNGLIKASALQLQNSPNIVPAAYADFEYGNSYYINSFWNANGQGGVAVSNLIADAVVAATATDAVKGRQYLSFDALGNVNTSSAYFAKTGTDYNIDVEPGKTYIWSLYMKNRATLAETWNINIKGDTGAQIATQAFVLSASESAYVRRTFAFTVPTGVNKILVWMTKPTSTRAALLSVDCMQVEEKTGVDNTPSPWRPPGQTTADGSGISTGLIRSNQNVTIAGVSQPAWSINTQGNMQIGDALVRGKLVIGTSAEGLPNRAPNGGDFEANVTGYSVAHVGATSPTIVRTTTGGEVINGTGSAKVTAAAGSKTSLGLIFNTVETYQPGAIITVTGSVKVNTTNASSFINVEFIDSSSNPIDVKNVVLSPVSGTVYSFNTSFAIGDGQNVAAVRIIHTGTAITSTSVIFDDLGLTASSEMGQSVVQSANFQPGEQGAGWRIGGQGDVEFNQGYFRGTLGAGIVTSDSFSSTIVIGTNFTTSTTGQRVEFNRDGIMGYRDDGSVMLQLPTDTRAAMFDGDLLASSLTISDQLAIRGVNNELSRGATLTLQSGTTSPTSPPTVTIDWRTIPMTTGDGGYDTYRYGIVMQGGWMRTAQQIYGYGVYIESYNITTGARQYGSLNVAANDGMWTAGGGMTSIGNNVYMLGQKENGDWRIMGWTLSTAVSGTPTRFMDVPYPQNARHRKPAIGTDGTNLIVGFSNLDTNLVYVWSFNATTGALIAPVASTTNLSVAADLTSINKGAFDDGWGLTAGTQVYVITSKSDSYAHVLNSSFQRMTAYDFPMLAKVNGQTYYGGKFYSFDAAGGRLQEHTNLSWNGASAANGTWHAVNTWYNTDATNGNKETTMGSIKSFVMKQRARLTVTSPPIPIRPVPNTVDDATAVGVYLARNSTTPTRTQFENNGYLGDGVRNAVFDNNTTLYLPTVGSSASIPPPSVSNFPDSSPSVLKSENGVFSIAGDGTGVWGDMQLSTSTGKVIHAAREFAFTPNSAWTNYGSPYGTAKFFRTADGLWVGSGLMKTTGTVSVPGSSAGVAIGVISGYTGATQQMMVAPTSIGPGGLALEIRTGGAVYLRSLSTTAYSFTIGQYVSFSGMSFHEAAA